MYIPIFREALPLNPSFEQNKVNKQRETIGAACNRHNLSSSLTVYS